ncbi:MAG: FAD-dependent oxidoreductase [Pyrinomonadaceae bacterium MAG19_C2-C3]|nr:FAD-dependent oxidoreductase [Pyrinomonadaceae bacterium MAG19_C2-C3]
MKIGILGAGIAGLSSAYFLRNSPHNVQVHEADTRVGGLARSFNWHGFDCDIAPHRLFTDDKELLAEMLALVPMKEVRRKSRIYLRGKWIQDPVNAVEMVLKFFPFTSYNIVRHFLFRKQYPEDSFEALVLNQFGEGLNDLFFKPYSEKLFGIPANQISAVWGRRKIRVAGLRDMLRRNSRLYFKRFYYPMQNGYGATCDRLYDDVKDLVRLESRLVAIAPKPNSDGYICRFETPQGTIEEEYDQIISSLPLSLFAKLIGLKLSLRFRPARITYLLVNRPRATDNHWFYFADKEFIINRVAEFKNFVENGPSDKTVLCCEVTDVDRWSLDEVVKELAEAKILNKEDVLDSMVMDIPHAYPVYDLAYEEQMQIAQRFFVNHPNIHHVGRHAQFAHKDIDEIFEEAKRISTVIMDRNGAVQAAPVGAVHDADSGAAVSLASARGAA